MGFVTVTRITCDHCNEDNSEDNELYMITDIDAKETTDMCMSCFETDFAALIDKKKVLTVAIVNLEEETARRNAAVLAASAEDQPDVASH